MSAKEQDQIQILPKPQARDKPAKALKPAKKRFIPSSNILNSIISSNENSHQLLTINSNIHSNINIKTNNSFDLKLQLQNATKENENLKKILNKLNKEIENLKILKLESDSAKNDSTLFNAEFSLNAKKLKLDDSLSDSGISNYTDMCGFCSSGTPCFCYTDSSASLWYGKEGERG
ncbi:unnamed protein product [Kuraishia capsulata CBS 1993]|uniref:Hap4 transcription factor heteromerisation domain-containing protein n=1 Tax=Kuraishia capsulata CBS 1993 TaxID=1382522 RepID=W6MG33_9ASCO|nr:uncharacterized protein KUCA_T00000637001 [Kuraishia capsulata CBS 1993]CDK24671.1 unnamed protein product [Kuraishia capsulata CBS 1993]